MRLFDMMTDEDIKRLNDENKKLKKRAEEAEGETSIVKGIGLNSPEMRAAQDRIKELEGKCREAGRAMIELNVKYEGSLKQVEELKADLARSKEDHQYDNLVHENELKSLNKK